MFFCGLDIGAATTKAVILNEGQMVSYSVLPTGQSVNLATDKVLEEATRKLGLRIGDIGRVVTTGYGRHAVPFAHRAISEIICHARGANSLLPSVRTVIDIGGQDSKVIALDGDGNVTNFVMNDKCAAGTGRFIEVMANVLEVPLNDMGDLSLRSGKPCMISSTCTVFAESEVVSLRAKGESRENLIAGIHKGIASRTVTMGRSIGFHKDVAFTGGVAKNLGVKGFLEAAIGSQLLVPEEPQIIGALGAALLAGEEEAKGST
ncbi:MAG: acyl-CoA dehydratase activase [Deltaproteobacteria bacterium]